MSKRPSTANNSRDWRLGAVLLIILAATTIAALKAALPIAELLCPLLLTISVLWWARLLYLWQRKQSFVRRERRRQADPAETLPPHPTAKQAEGFEGGQVLHAAQWNFIGRAVEAQGNYFASGILVAILSPIALLLFSVQSFALPNGGMWALGLVISEMLCLAFLLFLTITNREPTTDWIDNRVRTELFRREQYLCMAGVGPYLHLDSHRASQEAIRRKGQIEAADPATLASFIPMQTPEGLTWIEALHHKGISSTGADQDIVERMESYLHYRIGKQLQWFANELRDIRDNERTWSSLLTAAFLVAIGVAALDALHLAGVMREASRDNLSRTFTIVVGVLGIMLPPLGTACVSIRAMYNFRGRSRIYEHEKRLLHIHRGALEALILDAKTSSLASKDHSADILAFNFRAIALRTEQSLSMELTQWILLMEKHEHELAP